MNMNSSVKKEIFIITLTFCIVLGLTLFSVIAQSLLKSRISISNSTCCSVECSARVNATVFVIGNNKSLLPRLDGYIVISIVKLDRVYGRGIYVLTRPLSRDELFYLKKILTLGYPVICVDKTSVSQTVDLLRSLVGVYAWYNGTGVYLFKLVGPDGDGRYSLFEKGYSDHRVTCDVLCDAAMLLVNHIP